LRPLFADPALLAAHRALLPTLTPRKRGEVDVALVVALAKLEDCTTLTQAHEALTRQETMALLSDARGVDRLAALSAD
jgi:membrane glycosyltransferase